MMDNPNQAQGPLLARCFTQYPVPTTTKHTYMLTVTRLRILITIVALFGYEARRFDVSAAYLDGRLTVVLPPGDEC